jgi:hypothetical protein
MDKNINREQLDREYFTYLYNYMLVKDMYSVFKMLGEDMAEDENIEKEYMENFERYAAVVGKEEAVKFVLAFKETMKPENIIPKIAKNIFVERPYTPKNNFYKL